MFSEAIKKLLDFSKFIRKLILIMPNHPSFIIRDCDGIESHSAAVFSHKGFEISVSSIPRFPELMVFKDNENVNEVIFGDASPVEATAENVALAVARINRLRWICD